MAVEKVIGYHLGLQAYSTVDNLREAFTGDLDLT